MARSNHSPERFYERAQLLRRTADAIEIPQFQVGKANDAYEEAHALRDRLIRESERAWAEGGRRELARTKYRAASLSREGEEDAK